MEVTASQSVPNPGYSPWTVSGTLDTNTGNITMFVNGGSGSLIATGDIATVTAHFNDVIAKNPNDKDFYGSVVAALASVNATLVEQGGIDKTGGGIPKGDTAVPADAAAPGEELSAVEKAKLKAGQAVDGAIATVKEKASAFIDDAERVINKFGKSALAVGAAYFGKGGFNPNSADDVANWMQKSNPLHKFASYTYNISLHVISIKEWGMIMSNPKGYVPQNTIVASGGRRGADAKTGFLRNRSFNEDFYFDNLEFYAAISPTGPNRSTNAAEIKFTLIEPNGLTLLARLQELASQPEIGLGGNYVQLPYLIQIEFMGYGDNGQPIAMPEHMKRIPIKINDMKIKTGSKGTEYQITAGGFGQQAFSQEIGSVPASLEVQASTLEDFFRPAEAEGGTSEAETSLFGQRLEAVNRAQAKVQAAQGAAKRHSDEGENAMTSSQDIAKNSDAAQTEYTSAKEKLGGSGDNAYSVRSFVSAYNSWNRAQKENGQVDDYDEIYVVFADKIKEKSRIVQPDVQPVNQTPSPDRGAKGDSAAKKKAIQQRSGDKPAGPKLDAGKFPVASGTHITAVIDMCMMNSDYWRNQFVDPTEGDSIADQEAAKIKAQSPIYAWKIIPKLELKGWCNKRGRYAFKVTYFVKVCVKHNRKMPNGPKSMPLNWVREYWYYFTGLNTDIISWDFEFNSLYQTAVKVDNSKGQAVAGSTSSGSDAEKDGADRGEPSVMESLFTTIFGGITNLPVKKAGAGSGQLPTTNRMVSDLQSMQGGNMNRDAKAAIAAAMFDSMYSKSAEAAEAKLKIIGDPCFIKQDELYYAPDSDMGNLNEDIDLYLAGPGQFLDSAGTISTDKGDVHLRLTWKSPVDFTPATGMMATDSKYTVVGFSGIYSLTQFTSRFAQGKFEQDLTCVRVENQEDFLKGLNNKDTGANDRDKVSAPGIGIVVAAVAASKDDKDLKDSQSTVASGDDKSTDATKDEGASARAEGKTYGEFGEEVTPATAKDIPYANADSPIDKNNLPTGVAFDEAEGVPSYKGNLYLGGQKDVAAWKESIDAGQQFKYVTTADNGNAKVVST